MSRLFCAYFVFISISSCTLSKKNREQISNRDQSKDQSIFWVGARTAAIQPPSDYLEFYTKKTMKKIDIQMTEADWASLTTQAPKYPCDVDYHKDNHGYKYFTADLSMGDANDDKIKAIGIRKKGHCGSLSDDKPSLLIKFDHFVKKTDYKSLGSLALLNSVQDETFLRFCLANRILEILNQPFFLCTFAKVSVNGKDQGIYILTEQIKKTYLERNFGSKTLSVYEGGSMGSDFTAEGVRRFEAKDDAIETEPTAIKELIKDDFRKLFSITSYQGLLEFIASEMIIDHFDGYSRSMNNFYFAKDNGSNQIYFMTSGIDQTVKYPESALNQYGNSLLSGKIFRNIDDLSNLKAVISAGMLKVNESVLKVEVASLKKILRDGFTAGEWVEFDKNADRLIESYIIHFKKLKEFVDLY